jgi:hypothetical protein
MSLPPVTRAQQTIDNTLHRFYKPVETSEPAIPDPPTSLEQPTVPVHSYAPSTVQEGNPPPPGHPATVDRWLEYIEPITEGTTSRAPPGIHPDVPRPPSPLSSTPRVKLPTRATIAPCDPASLSITHSNGHLTFTHAAVSLALPLADLPQLVQHLQSHEDLLHRDPASFPQLSRLYRWQSDCELPTPTTATPPSRGIALRMSYMSSQQGRPLAPSSDRRVARVSSRRWNTMETSTTI